MPKAFSLISVAFVLAASVSVGVAQVSNWSSTNQSLGNLTVTGQVTGGFSFRGTVPYSGSNQLRLQLPSETIDNFSRDSMGMDRVLSGNLYSPQPYTSPGRATYMLRQSARGAGGFNAATGSVDTTGTAALLMPRSAPRQMVYNDYAFTPILSQEDIAKVVSQTDAAGVLTTPVSAISAVTTVDQGRPGTSALFGMIQASQRERLAESMLELKMLGDDDTGAALDDETLDGDRFEDAGLEPDALETPADGEVPGLPGRPDNMFADLLVRLSETDPATAQPQARRFGSAPPSGSLEQLDIDPSARTAANEAAGTLAGAAGRSVMVRDLAGTGSSLFNRYMAQGDKLLRAGRFYRAASLYTRAQLVHEFNPLASLGAGLAYLGAGESYRASYQLRQSIRLFPELVRVRVDIDSLIGTDVIDRRLKAIQDLIGEAIEPGEMPQVFLMAFIYANRGEVDQARDWAGKLAPLVQDDPRLRDYAQAILADRPATSTADTTAP